MEPSQPLVGRIQQAAHSHPYQWGVRKQLIIVAAGLSLAAVVGLLKVSLRYDSNESERWWWFYFTEQLVGWAQWFIELPILVFIIQSLITKVKSTYKLYLLIFVLLVTAGLIAASVEGLLWHNFFNHRPDWPWLRVWKASVSNRFGFHFLIAATTTLLMVIRLLWLLEKEKRENKNFSVRYEKGNELGSLVIRHKGKTEFLPLSQITHLSASGSYVEIFSSEGKTIITGSLKNLQSQLPDSFVRIHRSYIIKVDAVRSMSPLTNEDYKIVLSTGHELRLSRSYKESLSRLKGLPLE